MAGKKGGDRGERGGGEGSKKVQGQARKAEAAAQKAAAEQARREAAEAADWQQGAKSNSKKEAEAQKKADAAKKKAEREALIAEEERNTPGRAAPKNAKSVVKKTTSSSTASRGLDLSQLDDDAPLSALHASGIDNALDALSLTGGPSSDAGKIDRHPERRFKAAYAAFEERRMKEAEADGSFAGLRLKQKQDKIRKEFEKSDENPFNQANARYDSTKQELAELKEREKSKIETRLGAK